MPRVSRKASEPVVERRFAPDGEACAEAIKLLLDKAAARPSGGDNAKVRSKNDSRAKIRIS